MKCSLEETTALIPSTLHLIIEIVAPAEVLLYGFDRWRHRDNTVRTYGTEFPLVVRMWDRLVIPDSTDQKRADSRWHEKWTLFRNSIRAKGSEGLAWRAEHELDIYALRDKALACLALSSMVLPGRPEVFANASRCRHPDRSLGTTQRNLGRWRLRISGLADCRIDAGQASV